VELGVAPLWVFVKGIPVILIILCIVAGMVAARTQCRERMGQGSLSYGFYYRMPGSKSQTGWGAISKSAMTGVIVKQPTLCFRYRAFNSRMARMGQRLHVALNGYHAATVAVDTTSERSIYCDVSGMVGKWMSIELQTDKAFVPWKEHWFADSHAYGSLLSGPVWIKESPTNLIARFDGVWNVKWSADPEWYGLNGYTNVIQ